MLDTPSTTPRRRRGRTALAVGLASATVLAGVSGVNASSHREAPLIMGDPLADNTDVFAFRSPDRDGFVTLISNWVPAQDPGAGPNYWRFGEDVLYSIHVDNTGDAVADVTYEWRFRNDIQDPNSFLYTSPEGDAQITSLGDPNYSFRQVMDVFVVRDGRRTQLLSNQIVPPSNIGPVATPNYTQLANEGIRQITTAGPDATGQVFAGQRDDAFYADIASIFDQGQLRPFLDIYQPAPRPKQPGRDFFAGYNVHTTSIQVPITALLSDPNQPIIGVWSTASRPKVRVFNQNKGSQPVNRGRFVQVSRLANPLVNEVIIPLGLKDAYNSLAPKDDAATLTMPSDKPGVTIPTVEDPELARLLKKLYDIDSPPAPRGDLKQIFLTGITDVNAIEGAQPADLLRLNTRTAPTGTDPNQQSRLGLLAGENDGWPNGRRLGDDVVDIALRAASGGTPLSKDANGGNSFNRSPNNVLNDGVPANGQRTHGNDVAFLPSFPYQATPWQGFAENNETRGKSQG
jgi:hypothetical protein